MQNKTKYLNITSRVLSNDSAESQGNELKVIKVHFDMPNALSKMAHAVLNANVMMNNIRIQLELFIMTFAA